MNIITAVVIVEQLIYFFIVILLDTAGYEPLSQLLGDDNSFYRLNQLV